MLKKLSLLAIIGLASTAMTAFATPACSNDVTDNGSTYFDGSYSCQIGDLLFSNFKYTASGTDKIGKGQITVDTVTNDGLGLSFHAPWTVSGNNTTDGTIDFTVTVLKGGDLITDFGLAQTSGVYDDGTASVAENGCGPAPCLATGGSIYVMTFQDSGARSAQGETDFSGYDSVQVEKDISANANGGYASISVVQDTFSQSCPEPVSMALMGGGLAIVGLFGLKRRSKKA